jgi:6-phosphogluconate dehydrogenase
VAIPTIAAALDARNLSALKEERVKASGQIKGPQATLPPAMKEGFIEAVRDALYDSKICSYTQGLRLIQAGSKQYHWSISLREMARIWKGGCIIRAKLLDEIMSAYDRDPGLASLLLDGEFKRQVEESQDAWRRVVATAAYLGVPVPAMGASLAYFDSFRSAQLPQNLTQAQRDAFGAHTYQRADHPEKGFLHTEW